MEIKIVRFKKGHKVIFGKLFINDIFFCYTLERIWKNNKKNESCIPYGRYHCKPYSSFKYPNVTEITNVPDRSKILIHLGNYWWNTEGCILLGDYFEEKVKVKKRYTGAVYNSTKTLKKFFKKAKGNFQINIIDDINLPQQPNNTLYIMAIIIAASRRLLDKLEDKYLNKI